MDKTLGQRCPLRILIAEDNPMNQCLLERILKRLGYRSDIVENGRQAVEATEAALANASHYEAIFMDIQMPEMDGIEATREIFLRIPASHHPKIVVVTAHALAEYADALKKLGAHDFITKPIDKQRIADALETCYQALHEEGLTH